MQAEPPAGKKKGAAGRPLGDDSRIAASPRRRAAPPIGEQQLNQRQRYQAADECPYAGTPSGNGGLALPGQAKIPALKHRQGDARERSRHPLP